MNPQDNPHFTAYVLGELNAEEAAAVHQSLAQQVPAAAHELEQIEAVTDALRHGAPLSQARLTHEQRHAVLHPANLPRRVQPLQPRQPTPRPRASFWPVVGGLLKAAAVFALMGAAYFAGWSVGPSVTPVASNHEPASEPAAQAPVEKPELVQVAVTEESPPVFAKASPSEVSVPPISVPESKETAPAPEVAVTRSEPVKPELVVVTAPAPVAKSSANVIPNMGFAMVGGKSGFVSTTKQPVDQYSLRPAQLKPVPPKASKEGVFASPRAADAKSDGKHPAQSKDLYVHSWQAEVAASPWNPGHRLLRIVVQIPADQPAVISNGGEFPLRITFDAANVKEFRMLCERHQAARELRSAGTHVVWYEFLPNGGADASHERQIASVTLPNVKFTSQTVGPFDGSRLRVIDRGYKLENARDDFLFEASVVGFGLLMRGAEQTGTLDHQMVLTLAQKSAGKDAERGRFVRLVQDARRIAGL